MTGEQIPSDGFQREWADYIRDGLVESARERVCDLGPGDHGHTDCYLLSGLCDEAERLAAELEAEQAALSLAAKAIDAALAETRHLTAERDEAREWGERQARQRSLWYPEHERSWRVPAPPWAPPVFEEHHE